MELVSGVPITEYCDTKRLSVRARLELFVPVCQAVQHAQQNYSRLPNAALGNLVASAGVDAGQILGGQRFLRITA
jgi:hypothetical protein